MGTTQLTLRILRHIHRMSNAHSCDGCSLPAEKRLPPGGDCILRYAHVVERSPAHSQVALPVGRCGPRGHRRCRGLEGSPVWTWKEIALVGGLTGLGAWIFIQPFQKDHEAAVKLFEQVNLASAAEKLGSLDKTAQQIAAATAQWQDIQTISTKTVNAAGNIASQIAAEAKGFSEFLTRANDGEKSTLRLEIEKLRRGEKDSLQVVIHLMDHCFALFKPPRRRANRSSFNKSATTETPASMRHGESASCPMKPKPVSHSTASGMKSPMAPNPLRVPRWIERSPGVTPSKARASGASRWPLPQQKPQRPRASRSPKIRPSASDNLARAERRWPPCQRPGWIPFQGRCLRRRGTRPGRPLIAERPPENIRGGFL